jgi:hypothetical protein
LFADEAKEEWFSKSQLRTSDEVRGIRRDGGVGGGWKKEGKSYLVESSIEAAVGLKQPRKGTTLDASAIWWTNGKVLFWEKANPGNNGNLVIPETFLIIFLLISNYTMAKEKYVTSAKFHFFVLQNPSKFFLGNTSFQKCAEN